jgi:NADH-quinone oxidoreductase subunit N
VASKGAALVLLLRVLMVLASSVGYHDVPGVSLSSIAIVIGVLGSVTATVGNTAAFVQNNIKRLLAYSSIAHAGYMLCALTLLLQKPGPQAMHVWESAPQAILLYLAVYLFMNLGAFTVAGLIYAQTGSENINDYAALGRRSTLMAVCMAAFMFSLVGLPPFAGFIAKLNVMYVLGNNGGWWWALVAVIGVNTIFSLYYYARVIKVMFLNPSDEPALSANPLGGAIAVVCAVVLMWMMFQPPYKTTGEYGKIYLGSATASAKVQSASVAP